MLPWTEWEDFLAGMYLLDYSASDVACARGLLCDPDEFLEVAREMVRAWPVSAHHNLKNLWTGRNAWVGQASCLYAYGAPSIATREAWGQLTLEQQRAANAVADQVRIEREQGDVSQTLFAV